MHTEPPARSSWLGPTRPRPAFVTLASVVLGCAWGRWLPASPEWLYSLSFLAIAGAVLASGRLCAALLACAVVAISGGWSAQRLHTVPNDSLAITLAGVGPLDPGLPLTVRGSVLRTPRVLEPEADPLMPPFRSAARTRLEIGVRAIEFDRRAWARSGRITAFVEGHSDSWAAGDTVRVTGLARPIRPALNPGEPDRVLHAAQRHEVGVMSVPDATLVRRLGPDRSGSWLTRARAAAQQRAALVLGGLEDGQPRTLLGATLLGQRHRDASGTTLEGSFQRLGLAHFLAISGFHLAVLAGGVLLLARALGAPGRVQVLFAGLAVVVFLLVVPIRPPVLRAAMMLLALFAAETAGRRYDRLAVLAWVAVLIALRHPLDPFSPGYQLSVLVAGSLLAFAGPLSARFHHEPIRGVRTRSPSPLELAKRWFVGSSVVCVLAWAVSAPLIAHHFGLFSPLGPLASLLALPLVVPMLWAGQASVVLGSLAPVLGVPALMMAELAARVIVLGATWIDGLPGSSVAHAPISELLCVAWLLAIVLFVARAAPRGWSHRPTRYASLATLLALCVWTGLEVRSRVGVPLRLDTIAVGDGSFHLLRSGDAAVLVDAGSLSLGSARRAAPDALRALGVTSVRDAVVTHPNLDHYNLLPGLAPRIGLERLHVSARFVSRAKIRHGGPEQRLLSDLRALGVAVRTIGAGDTVRLPRATIEVLAPATGAEFKDVNDGSLVLLATPDRPADAHGAAPGRVLLTGDIQRAGIEALLASHPGLRAEAMEMPHHGSVTEAAARLIRVVQPRVVVQSTGPRRARTNAWDTLKLGTDWRVTAEHGHVWVEMASDGSVRRGSTVNSVR